MKEITSLTNEPNQIHQLVLDTNDTVEFHLYYKQSQQSWYFDFTYKNLTVNGSKVVLSPNSLRNFKNIIPFGIAFITDGFVEPYKLDDFSSGRIQMVVLNNEDVWDVERNVFLDTAKN
jgi:hypothetical protein|nr:MAG TPA: hypothetical protein [Caudoviricetes sp.]